MHERLKWLIEGLRQLEKSHANFVTSIDQMASDFDTGNTTEVKKEMPHAQAAAREHYIGIKALLVEAEHLLNAN